MNKMSFIITSIALLGGMILWPARPADIVAEEAPLKISDPVIESTTHGITFEDITFNQALQKAKKENKLVFMNVYATWCAPCKLLLKNTLSTRKIGTVFNKTFVNINIDAEKGEGIELARRYQVRAHPLMLIINPEGQVVKRILGYKDEAKLLAEVDEYIK